MNYEYYVNIHCHPTMKPFGKSFANGRVNNKNRKKSDSVWYYNPPSLFDKVANFLLTVTKFAQSDFSSSAYGNVRVICASLYPLEKGFCANKLGKGLVSDISMDFITEVGKKRIDCVQQQTSEGYFKDLEEEYNFLLQLHNVPLVLTDGRKYRYLLVRNHTEMLNAVKSDPHVIAVVTTFEGGHSLGCGAGPAEEKTLLANIAKVKKWEYAPFFITLGHHFNNDLCGHAKSLHGFSTKYIKQETGMDGPITPLGYKVIEGLLSKTNGRRILIDIKHMSTQSRKQYYELLDTKYKKEQIPLIVSHGCVTGNESNKHKFFTGDINFSDEEILRLAKSDGLFGIQLDERRIASEGELRQARGNLSRTKILYNWSRLVWNQVQHIAELLDQNGMYAWGNMCLGTDYDGIVDPINGFWTHENMPDLETYLLMHAHNYTCSANALQQPINRIKAEEIVSRVMSANAMAFFQKYFV